MKKLIIPIWLLGLLCLFHFSCEDDSSSNGKYEEDEPHIQNIVGNWSATKVEHIVDEISQDVSEYFDELEIAINENRSCCNINGCDSWATSCGWDNSGNILSNYLTNEDSGNVLFIKIISIKPSKIIAKVINKTPELKLFPDEDREGIYRITFVAI
jgi:hypothetical protein